MDTETTKYYQTEENPYKGKDVADLDSRFKNIVDYCNQTIPHKGKILDLACRDFALKNILWQYEVFGVDITDSKVDFNNEPIIVFDLTKQPYPFEDGEFDGIICSEFLEHVFSPEDILAECHRILKPNGKLIITVPNYNSIDNIINQHKYSVYNMNNVFSKEHIRNYTVDSMRTLLYNCKFTVEETTGNSTALSPFLRPALQRLGDFISSRYDKEIKQQEVDQLLGSMFASVSPGILFLCSKIE